MRWGLPLVILRGGLDAAAGHSRTQSTGKRACLDEIRSRESRGGRTRDRELRDASSGGEDASLCAGFFTY